MCEWNCKIHEPNTILNLSSPRSRCVCAKFALRTRKKAKQKLSAVLPSLIQEICECVNVGWSRMQQAIYVMHPENFICSLE